MTLRFYNGEYRFVLVDTEVHGCTDVVRHMRWRCPSLSSINIITIIYLAILCFFVVTPKAVIAQDTVAPPLVSGNVTIDTTEMVTLYTFVTSTITEDVCQHSWSNLKSVCELPDHCEVQPLNRTCSWRTDYVNHCRSHNSTKNCMDCLEKFESFNDDIEGYYSAYTHVLERYDCRETGSNYSVWTCTDCKLAYKDWLCATQIPYKIWGQNGKEEVIQPCEKFCERTEARCPYFLPQKPYCGQRTFFCKGPRKNARYSQNLTDRCFTCDFSLENDTAKSVVDLGCSVYLVNSTETSAASHTRGSVHSVLVALTLYILVSWTLSPTVVAGT